MLGQQRWSSISQRIVLAAVSTVNLPFGIQGHTLGGGGGGGSHRPAVNRQRGVTWPGGYVAKKGETWRLLREVTAEILILIALPYIMDTDMLAHICDAGPTFN